MLNHPSERPPQGNTALALRLERHLAFRRRIEPREVTQPGQIEAALERIRMRISRRRPA